MPDVLERPEPELLDVVEARLVAAAQVLGLIRREEGVVGVAGLPPVEHEVALGLLDVAQQLGADVAGTLPEELRPLTVWAVGRFEALAVAHLVAEDERDQRSPPRW